jgi:hypothetical protein
MTKRQGKGRLGRPKRKNQREIDKVAAEQAADAADDKIRSIRPQPVRDVGRCTVIRADDDDGPLTLRDNTDLENDNSAGLGLTAKERADDRKERQYVARIKGTKGKGARPRRGEVFGRRHLLNRPSDCKGWRPLSARPSDWRAMWTGAVGGLWVGLRRIKCFRLVFDIPNTKPRRFPFFIQAKACDVPILKFRHLIANRPAAGWAGAPDSVPPVPYACPFATEADWADECRRGIERNALWFTWHLRFNENEVPPEGCFALDIFCEELCDIWQSFASKGHHEDIKKWYQKVLKDQADKRFPPLPHIKIRQRWIDPYRRGSKGTNKRWSSAVVDVDGELKKRIKANALNSSPRVRGITPRQWKLNQEWRHEPKAQRYLFERTVYPIERPITGVTGTWRGWFLTTVPTSWPGWFLSLWACSAAITYVLGEPVIKPRVLLSTLVQDFLDRGGQIKICPPEKLSVERRKRGRPPLCEKAQTNADKQKKYRAKKKLQNAAPDATKPATALTVPPMSACPGVTASSPDCEAVTFGTDSQPE